MFFYLRPAKMNTLSKNEANQDSVLTTEELKSNLNPDNIIGIESKKIISSDRADKQLNVSEKAINKPINTDDYFYSYDINHPNDINHINLEDSTFPNEQTPRNALNLNNYKYTETAPDANQLLPLEQHFDSFEHDWDGNMVYLKSLLNAKNENKQTENNIAPEKTFLEKTSNRSLRYSFGFFNSKLSENDQQPGQAFSFTSKADQGSAHIYQADPNYTSNHHQPSQELNDEETFNYFK